MMSTVKILRAMQTVPGLSRAEIDDFLSNSKIPLRLGTVDPDGTPVIQPVWYYYENDKLYLMSDKGSRKLKNIDRRKGVYFSVDTEAAPYKGVKGKGTANIVKDTGKAVSMVEKIVTRYLGDSNNPMGKRLVGAVRTGDEILVQITPHYYSVWDYSKRT